MPVDVRTAIEIGRRPADVAAFAGNPENATAWYANIKSVERKTPPPLAVGSQVAFVAQFLGRRLSYTYEIVVLEPGSLLVMRTADGPFPMETTYRWTEAEGGTRMEMRTRGEPEGFSRFAAPLMARAIRRANNKDLRRLKRLLETSV